MTHAAIGACLSKLSQLMDCYRGITDLPAQWLDHVKVEHVIKGGEHPLPNSQMQTVYIYAGTVYQVCNKYIVFVLVLNVLSLLYSDTLVSCTTSVKGVHLKLTVL